MQNQNMEQLPPNAEPNDFHDQMETALQEHDNQHEEAVHMLLQHADSTDGFDPHQLHVGHPPPSGEDKIDQEEDDLHVKRVVDIPKYLPLIPDLFHEVPGNVCKSKYQAAALHREFEKNPAPKKPAIMDLINRTGMEYRECQQWFKGRRCHVKKFGAQPQPSRRREQGPAPSPPATDIRAKAKKMDTSRMSRAAVKRARQWAVQYSLVDDPLEKEFMVHALVDQLDVKRRKELRRNLVKQPLNLAPIKEYKTRKSSADPTLTRNASIDRSQRVWEYLRSRFGSEERDDDTDIVFDEDASIMLDAAMLRGLEEMFVRHRDYLLALCYRFRFHTYNPDRARQFSNKRQKLDDPRPLSQAEHAAAAVASQQHPEDQPPSFVNL